MSACNAIAQIVKQRLPELEHELEAIFTPGVEAIARRWPAAVVTEEFAAHVAERLAAQRDPAGAARRLHLDDLFLAWWAGTGDADGLAAFAAAYGRELDRIAGKFRELARDELAQQLRVGLFVGDAARIREYAGIGTLLSWLRVVATRFFIDLQRSARAHDRHDELDDLELLGLPLDPAESELGVELRAGLKRAFEEAVVALGPRHRAFLRHAYVGRLSLDQIASTYGVHRATVARTLADARALLIERTKAGIVSQIGLAPEELAADLGTLTRRLDLSLSRILRAD